jgi:hypothetical protein
VFGRIVRGANDPVAVIRCAYVGTAEAVPLPVIRSVIVIAALKRCATQKHPLLTFAIPTLAAKAVALAGGPFKPDFGLSGAVD